MELKDSIFPVLTAVFGYIGGRLHQSRERSLRRTDSLREAYAQWAAGMDCWHDALIQCMRAVDPESCLHERLDYYESQLDEARNRATMQARRLQVLEGDDAFLERVYATTVALPHVGQEAWSRLLRRAESGERAIMVEEYREAMDALIAELRKSRRLW